MVTSKQRRIAVVAAWAACTAASVVVGLIVGTALGAECASMTWDMLWMNLLHIESTILGFGVLAGLVWVASRLRRRRTA